MLLGINEWIGFTSLIIGMITVIIGVISIRYYKKQLQVSENERTKLEDLFIKDNQLLSGMDVLDKISQIILSESKSNAPISLLNMGLDLETVMPWLRYKLITNEICHRSHVNYKGLIVNPQSNCINNFIDGSSNVRSSFVKSSLESAEALKITKIKNYSVEIRSYSCLPIMYGFLLNDIHLFLSFTEIVDGKIMGGGAPYLYLQYDKASILNIHYFNVYKSWFKKLWSTANIQICIKK